MVKYKKFLFIAATVACSTTLTGCDVFGVSFRAVKKEAVQIAKEYVADKYGEEFEADEVFAYPPIGTGLPFPESNGNARVTDTEKGYSVFVDTHTGKVMDNKQSSEIKEAIKEEYITKNFADLDLEYTLSSLYVYGSRPFTGNTREEEDTDCFTKEMYYNGDLKEFLENNEIDIFIDIDFKTKEEFLKDEESQKVAEYREKLETAITKITNDFRGDYSRIYLTLYNQSSDYRYLDISSKSTEDSDGNVFWENKVVCVKYIEIGEGIYVSSLSGEEFNGAEDVVYTTEELPQDLRTNSEGVTVLTASHIINYESSTDTSYMEVIIDKEKFENGLLMDDDNFVANTFVFSKTFPEYEEVLRAVKHDVRESDKYLYLRLKIGNGIAICTKE